MYSKREKEGVRGAFLHKEPTVWQQVKLRRRSQMKRITCAAKGQAAMGESSD